MKLYAETEFSRRSPGRPSSSRPMCLEEAWERIRELENQKDRMENDKEKYYVRSEFLNLRLRFAKEDIAELKGENISEGEKSRPKNKQIKKNKKKMC